MVFLTTKTQHTTTIKNILYRTNLKVIGISNGSHIRKPSLTKSKPTITIVMVLKKYWLVCFRTENTEIIKAINEINKPNIDIAPGTKLGTKDSIANKIDIHPIHIFNFIF